MPPRMRLIPLVLCVALLTGCALGSGRSPESRHYVLTLPQEAAPPVMSRSITGSRVGVGPVNVPDYLDRSQILLRQGDSTDVHLAEFDRWGEPLHLGVRRLLVESLSARLAPEGGMALPLRANNDCDWRISLDVIRFDGAPEREVLLDAGWNLADKHGAVLREGHFVSKVKAGSDIDGLIRAHSELLFQLSDEMAKAVLAEVRKSGSRR